MDFLARLARMPQFAALRHRGFRLLWAATLLSSTARWADLVVLGWLALWHVIGLALVSGLTWALDNPTRNALAIEITVVVGPALGGMLIPVLGMGGAYGLITAILLLDVLVLLVVACLLNFLAAPYRYAFLRLFARYALDAGPAGYGMLHGHGRFRGARRGALGRLHGQLRAQGAYAASAMLVMLAIVLRVPGLRRLD